MNDQATDSPVVARAVLWASAFLIAALVVVQAGRLPANAAVAGTSAIAADDFALITARSGRGDDSDPEELLFVIDQVAETVLVYEIEDARQQELISRGAASLPNLFAGGRR